MRGVSLPSILFNYGGLKMISKYERTCVVCGEKYEHCNHCGKFDKEPRWKQMFHDENCMDIFYAITDYNVKEKTKNECRAILEECDLTNKNNFVNPIKEKIEEIFAEETTDDKKEKDIDSAETKTNKKIQPRYTKEK